MVKTKKLAEAKIEALFAEMAKPAITASDLKALGSYGVVRREAQRKTDLAKV